MKNRVYFNRLLCTRHTLRLYIKTDVTLHANASAISEFIKTRPELYSLFRLENSQPTIASRIGCRPGTDMIGILEYAFNNYIEISPNHLDLFSATRFQIGFPPSIILKMYNPRGTRPREFRINRESVNCE